MVKIYEVSYIRIIILLLVLNNIYAIYIIRTVRIKFIRVLVKYFIQTVQYNIYHISYHHTKYQ